MTVETKPEWQACAVNFVCACGWVAQVGDGDLVHCENPNCEYCGKVYRYSVSLEEVKPNDA